MTYAIFVAGFMLAIIVILVLSTIWQLAKSSLLRWSYGLMLETNTRLYDTNLKLESIQHQQERLLSGLERLERTVAHTQTSTLDELGSRLSKLEAAD